MKRGEGTINNRHRLVACILMQTTCTLSAHDMSNELTETEHRSCIKGHIRREDTQ